MTEVACTGLRMEILRIPFRLKLKLRRLQFSKGLLFSELSTEMAGGAAAAAKAASSRKFKTEPTPMTPQQRACPHDPARAVRGSNGYGRWTTCLACGAQTEYHTKRLGHHSSASKKEAAGSCPTAPTLEEMAVTAEGATKEDIREVETLMQNQNRDLAMMLQKMSELQLQSQQALSQQTAQLTKVVAKMAENMGPMKEQAAMQPQQPHQLQETGSQGS